MGEITDALRRAQENRPAGGAVGESDKPDREPPVFPSPRVRGRDRFAPLTASEQHCELSEERGADFAARAVAIDRRGPIAESCRHLALRVRSELDRRRLRSLAIVGPLRNEGKTTLACDLALALASVSKSREVALVDLDLRRPSVARALGAEVKHGVDEYLKGDADAPLADVRVSIDRPALDIFPVRRPQQSAHEILVGPAFARLVEELEQTYTTVVYDTPPALLVPDVSLILRHVGAYAVVARVGKTRKRAFRHMLGLLPKDRLIGSVLNEGPLPTHARHYGYYADDEES